MPDVFDVLRHDHDELKQMLTELEHGPTMVTGASDDEMARRRTLAQRVVMESSRHEAAEEQYFWPEFRRTAADGPRLADEALGQEQAAKQLLSALDSADPNHESFEQLLAEITQKTREHIAFEQDVAWPAFKTVITSEQANELADKVERAKGAAPTRPHPSTPPKPGILKTAGVAASMMDRVRDKISHRGR